MAAKELGIGVETIRYYERIGLIDQPIKPMFGHRLYDRKIRETLTFIKRAKTLGFSLSEISEILKLGESRCEETKEIAQLKLKDIQSKIRNLKLISNELNVLINECESNTHLEDCPIVSAISGK